MLLATGGTSPWSSCGSRVPIPELLAISPSEQVRCQASRPRLRPPGMVCPADFSGIALSSLSVASASELWSVRKSATRRYTAVSVEGGCPSYPNKHRSASADGLGPAPLSGRRDDEAGRAVVAEPAGVEHQVVVGGVLAPAAEPALHVAVAVG